MDLRVRLFATLRQGRGKEVTVPLRPGGTGHDLIAALDIPTEEVSIYLIDGHSCKLDMALNEENVVSIFPPVGGG